MFVVIKHGDDLSLLLNPQCLTIAFLRCIKEKCALPPETKLDLMDDTGVLKDLNTTLEAYANTILTPRSIYVLVRIDGDEEEGEPIYTPLLTDCKIKPRTSTRQPGEGGKQGFSDSRSRRVSIFTATKTTKSAKAGARSVSGVNSPTRSPTPKIANKRK
eukprot:Colp12_sorted_trinity150504_noHs@33325